MLTPVLEPLDACHVRWRGRPLLYFGGCDYFRFSTAASLRQAARQGLERWGLNVAASRRTTGDRAVYVRLERELARFFRVPAAVLVSSGYVTNLVVAQALAGTFTHALLDERAHAALVDAAAILGCPVIRFRHRSAADVERRLKRLRPGARPLLLTDGLFAHEGSVAPLKAYLRVLPRPAWLLVDEAHAAGVLGERGRGTAELEGVESRRLIRTITLSKAFGAYGGAILGSRDLRDTILQRSRLFAGNTPLPPPLANAALAALCQLRKAAPRRRRLQANASYLRGLLRRQGIAVPDYPGPIVAIQPRSPASGTLLRRQLLRAGILPPYLIYAARAGQGYFRFAISSAHRRRDLQRLAEALLRGREHWTAAGA
jgi:glycine C-acetyltransferase/8-amino-7-oxononanoate synthase